ncbi:MAG: FAD:protein FMN transferase [Planctomycetota bacterium]|nr:FAD:protein FMN transferase [Planctomycetota bacterium]
MHLRLGMISLALAACAVSGEHRGELQLYHYEAPAMGTLFRCSLYASDAEVAGVAWEAALDRITALEDVASDYDEGSELRRFCARPVGEWTLLSRDLERLLVRSRELAELTDGAFDPTVGAYVRLWRRARRSGELPTRARIEAAAGSVGMSLVEMRGHEARTLASGMKIDLGAIAKGDALDQAMIVLREHGIESALLDGGGDLVIGVAPPGAAGWKVALRPLGEEGPVWGLELSEVAIATSGEARSFTVDGVSRSHIIDPRTGWALTSSPAATVIAADGATADALASALCVMGKAGIELIKELPCTEGSLWSEGNIDLEACATQGLRQMMATSSLASPGDK